MFLRRLQVAFVLIIIPLGILYWYSDMKDASVREIFLSGIPIMHIGNIPVRVEIAKTEVERRQGLSGRKELEDVNGLLFVFPAADYHGIWMKDMSFAIDIIWISEDLKVIGIEKNVLPESYPKIYRPAEPVRYLIETNSGYVDTYGVSKGEEVRLPLEYLD